MRLNRVLSLALVFVLLFSLSSFASASGLVGETASSIGTFWTAASNSFLMSSLNKWSLSSMTDSVCSFSEDSKHHGTILSVDIGPAQGDGVGRYFVTCRCSYCNNDFQTQVYNDSFKDAYEKYVAEDLPTPVKTIDSEYSLIWKPTVYDMRTRLDDDRDSMYTDPSTLLGITAMNHFIRIGSSSDYAIPDIGDSGRDFFFDYTVAENLAGRVNTGPLCFIAPADGTYIRIDSPRYVASIYPKGSTVSLDTKNYASFDYGLRSAGGVLRVLSTDYISRVQYAIGVRGTYYMPTFAIEPTIPLDTGVGGSFGPDTRPGNMTGDFGYVGENGDVSKVGDTYFFDESNTTYHNPVTGDTSNVTEWNYDYSDRSYTVVTDSGNTVTITYGDENVNVTEYVTNEEGDTVTNNYTYYYLVENVSGPSDPDTPDTPHTHNYSETVTRAATCIMFGIKTFTCSCGDSYTQNIAATGHSWVVKNTVLTQYDESGNLVQQGYTIFRCSTCGEENKSETGTVPPGGSGSGAGSGSGSGGLFSGIFSIIWDFFSFFWSLFNDFVVGGIRGFLNGIFNTAGTFLSFLNPFNWFS